MNKIKYITLLLAGILIFSCSVDYEENPNEPTEVPTNGIFTYVQKELMDDTRDEWWSGRQALLWVQYWNQVNYTEEDGFSYRETVNLGGWDDLYGEAQDLIDVIQINEDEATSGNASAYGSNANQIAACRIMLVYIYQQAVEVWGDVPYWSYGSDNDTFQANSLESDGISAAVYASQEDIYVDMLKELDEAFEQIDEDETVMEGDLFYDGDAKQWKKFANSLRLRIANRIKGVYDTDAIMEECAVTRADYLFTSNDDSPGVSYEDSETNGAPMYLAFNVENRTDFAPSMSFVELLQGKRGPFGLVDPRLDIFVADNDNGDKVGIPLTSSNDEVAAFIYESLPGDAVLSSTYTEYYMEYAEVCFIMSEYNGWDQTWYEAGVRASMDKWGVADADIDAYIDALPAASEETVMMQKYIALYMQPYEAWAEYRRTGYPNTLIKPYETYDYTYPTESGDVKETFTFTPEEALTDLPARNGYLLNEYSVNATNVANAASAIGGDVQDTDLWWME